MSKNNITTIKLYVTNEELLKIVENADRWSGGDISAWVRYSAVFGQPQFQHLDDKKEVDDFFKVQVARKNLKMVKKFERGKIYVRLKPLEKRKKSSD